MHKRPRAKEQPKLNLVIGRNSVREVLLHLREEVQELFFAEAKGERQRDSRAQELLDLARSKKVRVSAVSLSELTRMVGSEAHQSFAALLSERPALELKSLLEALEPQESSLLVMLDSVNDPQNFGAILRAAECFAVDAVIYSKNRGSPVSPVVSKVSAGASELVPLCAVSNLVEAARKIKKAGFWLVACDVDKSAIELPKFEFPQKAALILGSEGSGLQKLLLEQVDYKVSIPMLGKIDSLNVSQAAAVIMYAARAAAQAP